MNFALIILCHKKHRPKPQLMATYNHSGKVNFAHFYVEQNSLEVQKANVFNTNGSNDCRQ